MLSFLKRIWHTRGFVTLDEALGPDEAFDRLAPLFDDKEVEFDRGSRTLIYRKSNPAAQHKLATFSSGTLQFVESEEGAGIAYTARSPALLLTFLAPLLFVAFGQALVGLGMIHQASSAEEAEKEKDEEEEPGELHWIDQALGAPAPEKPDKDKKKDKDGDEKEETDEDFSPMPSYGLAAFFLLIYLVGRVLEPRLLRKNLRKILTAEQSVADAEPGFQN